MAAMSRGIDRAGHMGEPMCANLARKSASGSTRWIAVLSRCSGWRRRMSRLAPRSPNSRSAPTSFSCHCQAGARSRRYASAPGGIAGAGGRTRIVVDCGTSPVGLTRSLAARLGEIGIDFADAPVARTREAAQQGRLSIMVGGSTELFEQIGPYLATMGTDVTHCGPVGCGQVVKILNNMVLFETVGALAEALAIGGRAGVDERLLLETLSEGSADSFALRNHGMKAMLPRHFPDDAFCTEYALKDLGYALDLARAGGVGAAGAEVARERLIEAIRRGHGRKYWPVLLDVVAGHE